MRKTISFFISTITNFIGIFLSRLAFAQESPQNSKMLFSEEISTAKKLIDTITEYCVKYSFQVLGGLIVLILGWILAKIISRFVGNILKKRNVDVTLTKFIVSAVKILIIAFSLLVALGKFGITIAPFIAGLSVVGFGATFALQGPLSNYAAGFTLIFTKPFKVGDIIEVAGVMGEVRDLTLARTELITVDGTLIVIPNKQILGEIIHNYSNLKKLDIKIGVSYDSDIDKAIKIINDIISVDERISKTPTPKTGISEFADSSINIYSRIWCPQKEYFSVLFSINKQINDIFKKEGITIPFPQRDIHLFNEK